MRGRTSCSEVCHGGMITLHRGVCLSGASRSAGMIGSSFDLGFVAMPNVFDLACRAAG